MSRNRDYLLQQSHLFRASPSASESATLGPWGWWRFWQWITIVEEHEWTKLIDSISHLWLKHGSPEGYMLISFGGNTRVPLHVSFPFLHQSYWCIFFFSFQACAPGIIICSTCPTIMHASTRGRGRSINRWCMVSTLTYLMIRGFHHGRI